jgi:hypothetical protein
VTKTENSFIVTAGERTKIKILKMVKPHWTQIFFWHWHLASIRDLVSIVQKSDTTENI